LETAREVGVFEEPKDFDEAFKNVVLSSKKKSS
jgi:hypothetical protein